MAPKKPNKKIGGNEMKIKEIIKIENIKNDLSNVIGKRFTLLCLETEIVKFKHPSHTVSYLCSEFKDTEYEVKVEYFKNKDLKTSHWIGQDKKIIHDLVEIMEKQLNIEWYDSGLQYHWDDAVKKNTERINNKNFYEKLDYRDEYKEAINKFWELEM